MDCTNLIDEMAASFMSNYSKSELFMLRVTRFLDSANDIGNNLREPIVLVVTTEAPAPETPVLDRAWPEDEPYSNVPNGVYFKDTETCWYRGLGLLRYLLKATNYARLQASEPGEPLCPLVVYLQAPHEYFPPLLRWLFAARNGDYSTQFGPDGSIVVAISVTKPPVSKVEVNGDLTVFGLSVQDRLLAKDAPVNLPEQPLSAGGWGSYLAVQSGSTLRVHTCKGGKRGTLSLEDAALAVFNKVKEQTAATEKQRLRERDDALFKQRNNKDRDLKVMTSYVEQHAQIARDKELEQQLLVKRLAELEEETRKVRFALANARTPRS